MISKKPANILYESIILVQNPLKLVLVYALKPNHYDNLTYP